MYVKSFQKLTSCPRLSFVLMQTARSAVTVVLVDVTVSCVWMLRFIAGSGSNKHEEIDYRIAQGNVLTCESKETKFLIFFRYLGS